MLKIRCPNLDTLIAGTINKMLKEITCPLKKLVLKNLLIL